LHYPKDEGTYDPNDEEAEDSITAAIPETWLAKITNEKVQVIAQEGID
jgi:hypothetical protein